jgi:hypothetical protein
MKLWTFLLFVISTIQMGEKAIIWAILLFKTWPKLLLLTK